MPIRTAIALLTCVSLLGCAGDENGSAGTEAHFWNREVRVHGALRAMMHEGKTEATVSLDTILPDPDLYAVGALAGLSGEVTVVGGKAYLSYPQGAEATRTDTTRLTNEAATLFVAADVPAWESLRTEHPIRFEDLDESIAKLAAAAGMHIDGRFPFLLEGEFEDLEWHVIDGSRLTAAGASPHDHSSASIKARRDRAEATLIGFYSESDQGVFTHMGSRTHIHCVLDEPLASGHVDHVTIPAGVTVRFPHLGR